MVPLFGKRRSRKGEENIDSLIFVSGLTSLLYRKPLSCLASVARLIRFLNQPDEAISTASFLMSPTDQS